MCTITARTACSAGAWNVWQALNSVYHAVVIAKLTYAPSAWWRSTNSSDRQHIEAFVRRDIRCVFCRDDDSTVGKLMKVSDQALFKR